MAQAQRAKATREENHVKPQGSPRKAKTMAVTASGDIQPSPRDEEIAALAYSYWEERGGDGGSPEEDWLRAERELRTRLR